MDGIESLENVVVIGTSNRPDIIDPAILRPGRFDRLIYVPPPDHATRLQIFKIHTKNMPLARDVELDLMASRAAGYSGADIEAVCREAGLVALRQNIEVKEVTPDHCRDSNEWNKSIMSSSTEHWTKCIRND